MQFTRNLERLVAVPPAEVPATTVAEALQEYFRRHPDVERYVFDDQGGVRKHVTVFVNQDQIRDRAHQSDAVADGDLIYVMQALSGG